LELSVVTNSEEHFKAANSRKEAQYGSLISNLEPAGFTALLATIEVGCLGHFLPTSVSNTGKVCHLQKNCVRNIFGEASKVVISGSYQIFNASSTELWNVTCLLTIA